MNRKLITLLVVAAMVLAMAPAAFAGAFSDVSDDATYASAVNRLAGLGVLQGIGEGKYDPESSYTRAQFAALMVKLLGLSSAADASKGATEYSDVAADHWGSGWINVATSMNIIRGMGDGTFAPDAPVTHAQALTMVVRALGYEPALKGTWPANVLVKAAELGLDNGVKVYANVPASRGEVAIFADNGLDVDLMEKTVSVNETTGQVTANYAPKAGKNILNTYLKSSSVEGWLVVSPEDLTVGDTKRIGIDTDGDGDADGVPADTDATVEMVAGTSYTGLLGHKVKVWKNKDGKAYFIEDKTEADQVLIVKSGDITGDPLTKVKVGSTEYDLADLDGAAVDRQVIYVKDLDVSVGSVAAADVAAGAIDNDKFVAILNDDNKVQSIIRAKSKVAIVDSVSAANEAITCTGDAGFACPGSLKDKKVIWSGAASSVGDLQKGDVLEWLSSGDKYNIVVTRNNKTGKLNSFSGDKVDVGGTSVDKAKHTVLVGWDSNDNLGKSVTAYVNKNGKFVAVKSGTVTEAAASPVAMIRKGSITTSGFDKTHQLRVLKADGTSADLTIADEAKVYDDRGDVAPWTFDDANVTDAGLDGIQDAINAKGVIKGNAIEYTLNSNGKIEKIIVLARVDGVANAPDADKALVYEDPSRIKTGDDVGQKVEGGDGTQAQTTYALASSTVVFDTSAGDDKDWKTMTASSLTADDKFTGKVARDKDNTAVARIVVVTGNFNAGVASDRYGLIMGRRTVTGPKCLYTMNERGTTSDIEALNTDCDVDGNVGGDQVYNTDQVLKYRVVGSKFDGANTSLADEDTMMGGGAKVWQVDTTNNIIKVDGNGDGDMDDAVDKSYLLMTSGDNPTQYFNLNDDSDATSIDISGVLVGDKISVWTDGTDDSVARVIVVDR